MSYPGSSKLPQESYTTKTVIFADMSESTKMKWETEWRVAYKITRRHNDIVRRQVERHGGLVVNEIGDGVLALFDRPEEAVNTAIGVMRSLAKLRQVQIESKIAIHTGSICLLNLGNHHYDVFGSAVDIVARILALCRSKEILISTITHYELSGKKKFNINRIGNAIKLRHIESPLDIYSVVWNPTISVRAGIFLTPADQIIENIFPRATDEDATTNLKELFKRATREVIIFGLTRNYYTEHMLDDLEQKARELSVKLFLMDPDCPARKERYRLEPIEAALEDPKRFSREVVTPLKELKKRIKTSRLPQGAGLSIKFFNFYPSFSMEFFDDFCRLMLYGHYKRGTDSPIFIFRKGDEYYQYFRQQIDWVLSKSNDPDFVRDIEDL